MNLVSAKKLQKARQLLQLKNHGEALKLYAQVAKEWPQCGVEYGRAAAQTGDFELASRIWEKTRLLEPGNASHLSQLACEFGLIGLHSKSRALFSQAASLDPRNLDVQIKAAWLLSRTNGVVEARTAVKHCLTLDANNQQARYLSAYLDRRENKLDLAERQLRDLLASGVPQPHVRYACHSDLAQILDRTERFDEAIAQSEEGKNFLRRGASHETEQARFFERQRYEVQKAKSLPQNILESWANSYPAPSRNATPRLAFLTGSARSGTTLLEKVLDAHPSIAACDEVPAFQKIQPLIDLAAPSIPAQRLNVLRDRYMKNLIAESGPIASGKILVDKNPQRTFWLPALLRAFPDLRVLIALRDPRDVMISLYFQDHPNTNSLTFEQLAQRYAGVMDVWLAVREWKGVAWLETRYEDVVADLQKEGSRVTQFLGLAWHENQACYHEKNREKPILSTNYSDVTKPVYTRAIGRWRAYEKYLAPVLPMLEPYCKKFGYI